MRSKLTNILQVNVLITGVFYSVIGLLFFIMPFVFGKIFAINVPEEWVNQLVDQFQVFLYLGVNSFSLLLFTTGLSMILPLFDPLKYRGLIYFNGVIFPLIMLAYLIFSWIFNNFRLALFMGIVFCIIFVINFTGIILTSKEAKNGIE